MSKTVIFGITGYAGGSIANELLHRGHNVVGIAAWALQVAVAPHSLAPTLGASGAIVVNAWMLGVGLFYLEWITRAS